MIPYVFHDSSRSFFSLPLFVFSLKIMAFARPSSFPARPPRVVSLTFAPSFVPRRRVRTTARSCVRPFATSTVVVPSRCLAQIWVRWADDCRGFCRCKPKKCPIVSSCHHRCIIRWHQRIIGFYIFDQLHISFINFPWEGLTKDPPFTRNPPVLISLACKDSLRWYPEDSCYHGSWGRWHTQDDGRPLRPRWLCAWSRSTWHQVLQHRIWYRKGHHQGGGLLEGLGVVWDRICDSDDIEWSWTVVIAFVELYHWFFVDTWWLVWGSSRGFGCQHVEDLGRQAPGHLARS